jgi:hypothetical protein
VTKVTAECRAYARNDLYRHASRAAGFGFFAAPPENEGVAALEAHHVLPVQRLAHQQGVDLVLRHGVARAALGHGDQLGCRMGHGQDRRIDKPVMDDDPRLHDQPRGAQRQQVGIAGTGADQPDLAQRASGKRGGFAHSAAMAKARAESQSV